MIDEQLAALIDKLTEKLEVLIESDAEMRLIIADESQDVLYELLELLEKNNV